MDSQNIIIVDGGYNSVAIQNNGKIVAAGFVGWGSTSDFAIGRYLGSYVPVSAVAPSAILPNK